MDYLLLIADSLPIITTTCEFNCAGNYTTGNTIASADSFEFTMPQIGNWEVQMLEKSYIVFPGQIEVYPPMIRRNALALNDITHKHSTIYMKNIKSFQILTEEQFFKQALILKTNKAFSATDFRLLLPVIIDGNSNRSLIIEFYRIIKEHSSEKTYSKPNSSAMLLQFLTMVSDLYINNFINTNTDSMKNSYTVVQKMVAYINDNFSEIKNVNQIAVYLNYNSSYLSTAFKKYTGYKTINYINKLRVEKAKEIIQQENISFVEVASLVGVENIYYFYRVFKKYTGMTMGKYSKMLYR